MVVDPEDRIRKLVGVFIDMTDTEHNRASLVQALQEKENLLIEVNHRVKNSLQLVTSILRMEARRIANPEVERRRNAATHENRLRPSSNRRGNRHCHRRGYRDDPDL